MAKNYKLKYKKIQLNTFEISQDKYAMANLDLLVYFKDASIAQNLPM